MSFLFLSLTAIFCLLGSCTNSNSKMNQSLLDQLNEAIQKEATACNIMDVVNTQPLINTCNERDRLILEHADFDADIEDLNLYVNFKEAEEVVYWKVEDPTEVKIIGLCWYDDGSIKLFKAIVLPP